MISPTKQTPIRTTSPHFFAGLLTAHIRTSVRFDKSNDLPNFDSIIFEQQRLPILFSNRLQNSLAVGNDF